MKYKQNYTLLTFYKFVDVADPEKECLDHLIFCKDIGIKWRIYIWTEGISATVTCNEGQLKAYKMYLDNHDLFNNPNDFDVKMDKNIDGHQFERMTVKVRDEIVALWKKYTREEIEEAGNRMEIEEFKDLIDNGNPDDYVILDMRNDYEYKLWHFKWAIPANTINFRELDSQVEEYKKKFGDKKIITYCTGWIRCEKSTVMLQKAGLKQTYQLDWWVVKYVNSFNDGNWLGNLYVFDGRVSQEVWDENTHTTIWECIYTWEKTDNCENCRYSPCNARLIASPKAYRDHYGFCSEECAKKAMNDCLVREVDFDKMDYKNKRGQIKRYPNLKDEIMSEMQVHLAKNLDWIEFNHKENQKEEIIID